MDELERCNQYLVMFNLNFVRIYIQIRHLIFPFTNLLIDSFLLKQKSIKRIMKRKKYNKLPFKTELKKGFI